MAASLAGVFRQASWQFGRKLCRQNLRLITVSSGMSGAHDAQFEAAQKQLNALKNDPGNQAKLEIYALFKQATKGKCNTPKPGMMDFVGKAKWEAWNKLGDMSQDDAQKTYVDLVAELSSAEGAAPSASSTEEDSAPAAGEYEGIKTELRDNMFIITLNRPDKKNAWNRNMYGAMPQIMKEAADSDCSMAVITGAGDYYSSGNDLSNFMSIDPSNLHQASKEGGELLRKFVASFIDFPKPMVAVVNGPVIGVSCTTLGLMDVVYATDRATFQTPFSALGQTPEGCSSYIFPKLMGTAKANEMLLFNRKLTAHEACERGLVAEVLPDSVLQQQIWPRLKEMAANPPQTMRLSKTLGREEEREMLHRVNVRECEQLVERWTSEECLQAIMTFFSKKSKV